MGKFLLTHGFKGTNLDSQYQASEFELIFEGISDSSPETIRKIKGILISDLELSITEVQRILESHPLTIGRSPDENKLLPYYLSLKDAGAKVLLLRPKGGNTGSDIVVDNSSLQFDSEEINDALSDSPSPDSEPSSTDASSLSDNELEFEIEFESSTPEITKKIETPPKTYELNIDEDSSDVLAELKESWGEEGEILTPTPSPTTLVENIKPVFEHQINDQDMSSSSEFSLEIAPPTEGLELIDSSKIPNDLDENGEWGLNTLSGALSNSPSTDLNATLVEKDLAKSVDLSQPLLKLDDNPAATTKVAKVKDKAPSLSEGDSSAPLFSLDELNKTTIEAPNNLKVEKSAPSSTSTSIESKLDLGELDLADEEAVSPKSENITPHADVPKSQVQTNTISSPETVAVSEPSKSKSVQEGEAPPKQKPPKAKNRIESINQIASSKEGKGKTPDLSTGSKKKKTSLPLDILLPVAIGGLLLAAGNWYYFSFQEAPTQAKAPNIPKHVLEKNEVAPVTAAVPTTPAVKLENVTYTGKLEQDDLTITLSLDSDTNTVTNAKFEITTKAPAPLSPEEIVNNVPARPWLRKIEMQDIPFEKNSDGELVGRGPAKSYIERGDFRTRLVGTSVITLKELFDRSTADISIEITLNYVPGADETRSFFIEEPTPGQFRYLLRSKVLGEKLNNTAASEVSDGDNTESIKIEVVPSN